MADEPRRSGRATKGQHHKKEDDEVTPAPPTQMKGKKKKAGAKTKKAAQPEEEEDEEEEGEEGDDFIRCICGVTEDDGSASQENWIGCENCHAWQHCDCVGVGQKPKTQPKTYLCEQCGMQQHPDLEEAAQKGTSFKKVAEHNRKEYAKFGEALFNKKKGGRKSEGPKESVPPETEEEQSNSKAAVEEPAQPTQPQQPSNKRKPSSAAPAGKTNDNKRRKSEPPLDPTVALVKEINQLGDQSRIKVASGLQVTLKSVVGDAIANGSFTAKDGDTPAAVAEQLALKIEYSMFMNYVDDPKRPDFAGSYKDAFLRIQPNLKRNPELTTRLLDGSLKADTLAQMKAEEMQSEKQRKADAATMKRLEKQHFIEASESKPRIRRTHKGDEVVEDQNIIAAETLSSIAPTIRRRESQLEGDAADSPMDAKSPVLPDTESSNADAPERRKSSEYDIKEVWRTIGGASKTSQQPVRRYSSNAPPAQAQNAHDLDIDRLLDDGATESAPYSPVDYDGVSGPVWRGKIGLKGAATLTVKAVHAGGADLSNRGGLRQIFKEKNSLLVSGRIPIKDAVDYISGLFAAENTDVCVFDMIPDYDDNSAMRNFDQLFDYFMSRQRWGVVPEEYRSENVRDVYFFPVEKDDSALPTFMTMLDKNDLGEPGARDRRHICAVFVIRYKPIEVTAAAATPIGAGSILSPVNGPPGSAMSPTAPGFPERGPPIGVAQNGSNFPSNPYGQQMNRSYDDTSKRSMISHYLGEHADAPAAVQLLKMAGDVDASQLQGLRRAFDEAPETRSDLTALTRHLQATERPL